MTLWTDILRAGADELGVSLSQEEEAQYAHFLALLLDGNARMNLTAITDPGEIAAKHFVDALSVETLWRPHAGDRVIDIGTGAGFPGLPLAIRHPEVDVTLNDSVRKKVEFLREAAAALHLANVTACWARAEALGRDPAFRAGFNAVFARALAHLAVLVEYALPLLKVGGTLVAMKGPGGEGEVAESGRALALLGGHLTALRRLQIRGAGERLLVQVTKVRPTPEQYPRDAAAMKKKPFHLDSERGTP